MIYFTSDLHLNHDKEFIYKERGFSSVEEMNTAIINNINETLTEGDELFILGDLMLGDNAAGIELLKAIQNPISIILGNHDTNARITLYQELENVKLVEQMWILNMHHRLWYLTHYPLFVNNYHAGGDSGKPIYSLSGHTHSKDKFHFADNPYLYNVAVDAHNMKPVSFDTIRKDIEDKKRQLREVICD